MRRPRLLPRTLRGRLTLGLVVLLAVIFAGVGVATTTLLRHFLVDRLDQQLTATGPGYAKSLEHGQTSSPDTRGQAVGTFGARLLGGTVTQAGTVDGDADDVQTATGGQPVGVDDQVSLSAADRRMLAALPADGSSHSVRLSTLGEYRVQAVAGRDGDVLVTGLPLEHTEGTVRQLAEAELALFGCAVLVAAVGGAAWVRLALRPLDRVTRTAERVSTLSLASGEVALDVRVPDEDPATEVGRVGASLNRVLGHVEDALAQRHAVERRLREFAADAGHELRTPVAAVRGHAELALRRGAALPEDARHALTRIEAEAQRMGTVVDDLLLLARLDAGRPLEREEVDLTRLALDAVEGAQAADAVPGRAAGEPIEPAAPVLADAPTALPAVPGRAAGEPTEPAPPVLADAPAPAPDQSVKPPTAEPSGTTHTAHRWLLDLPAEPVTVPGDSHRLAQAVANLVTNARVHTPPGTCVTLAVASQNGEARLSVADTGPGLPPDLAARAFDRFARGDRARSRTAGSTGLGLAITRAVAEAHGGRVELDSSPGRTVFTLVLPRDHTAE